MKHGLRIVCSAECKKIRDRQTSMAWQREHKKHKKEFEFVCATCGKTFITNKPNKKRAVMNAKKSIQRRHKKKQKKDTDKSRKKCWKNRKTSQRHKALQDSMKKQGQWE